MSRNVYVKRWSGPPPPTADALRRVVGMPTTEGYTFTRSSGMRQDDARARRSHGIGRDHHHPHRRGRLQQIPRRG